MVSKTEIYGFALFRRRVLVNKSLYKDIPEIRVKLNVPSLIKIKYIKVMYYTKLIRFR